MSEADALALAAAAPAAPMTPDQQAWLAVAAVLAWIAIRMWLAGWHE